jgi:hypothetical protein
VRSAVVVIVVRDALTDHRIVECGSLWDMCLCCGPSRTYVDHVRFYAPPSPQWSFDINLSFRPLEFRVSLFVRTCVCAFAVAVATVGVSQSWFHVPVCSTLLLLGRCRASTYSSSAPSDFFSATCVLKHLPITHR